MTLAAFIVEAERLLESNQRWELLEHCLTIKLPFFEAVDYEEAIYRDADRDTPDGSLSSLLKAGMILRVLTASVFAREVIGRQVQNHSLRLRILAEKCVSMGRKETLAAQDRSLMDFLWDLKFN